jgi:hypothetical protein
MDYVTGWEIESPMDHLPARRTSLLKEFVSDYNVKAEAGCAALSPNGETLVIIRKYHQTLNVWAGDPDYGTDDYAIGLAYFRPGMYTWFYLPKSYAYTSLRVSDAVPPVIEIDTVEKGTVATNSQELSRKLSNYRVGDGSASDESWLLQNFLQLSNHVEISAPRIPITQSTIELPLIGKLRQVSGFDEWWTRESVQIPYFNEPLPVTVMDFHPQDPKQRLRFSKVSEALSAFLNLGEVDRMRASELVYENCKEFIDAVGVDAWNQQMADLHDPKMIWQFVHPREVLISYSEERDAVFVVLSCECDWEDEHGLQLLYRDGKILVRVSQQDGHYTD